MKISLKMPSKEAYVAPPPSKTQLPPHLERRESAAST